MQDVLIHHALSNDEKQQLRQAVDSPGSVLLLRGVLRLPKELIIRACCPGKGQVRLSSFGDNWNYCKRNKKVVHGRQGIKRTGSGRQGIKETGRLSSLCLSTVQ